MRKKWEAATLSRWLNMEPPTPVPNPNLRISRDPFPSRYEKLKH